MKSVSNPRGRFVATEIDWEGEAPAAEMQVRLDHARSVLSRNDSPDIPFTYTANPYRGCFHGCAYCYARPTHEYLELGAGTDFERIIIAKPEAPALLREAFMAPSWKGEVVTFSGVTDCYQPLEARMGLTRGCLEVCREFRNPAQIITKSALIERDAQLLAELSSQAWCSVAISVPFFSSDAARAIEPYVPSPARRLRAVETLASAGVPVGVSVAPVIPGLSDADIPRILRAAADAGATFAWMTMLRLPGSVEAVFIERLREALPLRAERVLAEIRACREGRLSDPRFGNRMTGTGERWRAIEKLFEVTSRAVGLGPAPVAPTPSPFRRPGRGQQLTLF